MFWKVYKIQNEDGKVYIGCTKLTLKKRIGIHKSDKKLFVLIPYSISILFETNDYNEARVQEALMIQKYDSTNSQKGYNKRFGDYSYGFPEYLQISVGKNNPMYNKNHSEITKEKIRQKTLLRDSATFDNNRIKTPEQLKKLYKGRDEYIEKFGAYWKGKNLSEEAKNKLSQSAKGNKRWLGKKHSEESKEKIRQTKIDRRIILFCTIENCNKIYKAKGYCNMHYRKFLRHGSAI